MRRLVSVLLFVLPMALAAADGPSMQILYHSEMGQAIAIVYDVEFYEDGLVKTIKEYHNTGRRLTSREEIKHLQDLKFSSVRTVEQDESGIVVYLQEDGSQPAAEVQISFADRDELTATQVTKQRVFTFTLTEAAGEHSVVYEERPLFEYAGSDHGLTFDHLRAGYRREYRYDKATSLLSAIKSTGCAHGAFDVDVSYESVGKYMIVRPDSETGHGRFLQKYEIETERIEFSRVAAAVNYFLCPVVYADYLLPFFMYPMVPAAEETTSETAGDGCACGGLN